MKYGESTFDILYLVFTVVMGLLILSKRKDTIGKLMGSATLILGFGDAFHLIPRVVNYFADGDFSFWLGTGKMITSVTMTVLYVFMYLIWIRAFKAQENKIFKTVFYIAVILRIALCLLPQNRWFTNDGSLLMGIIRNIPFVVVGALIVIIWFSRRKDIKVLSPVWLLVTLSFAFYIPVTIGASFIPVLGALMLPKTVCYMLLIVCFWRYAKKDKQ